MPPPEPPDERIDPEMDNGSGPPEPPPEQPEHIEQPEFIEHEQILEDPVTEQEDIVREEVERKVEEMQELPNLELPDPPQG